MAFRLRRSESVVQGLRRLAAKQIRAAIDELRSVPPRDEAIHEARKRVKKARAILQLVEADGGKRLRKCRKRLRTVNRALTPLRDADASLEILDRLRSKHPRLFSEHTFARIKRELAERKRAAAEAAAGDRVWETIDEALRSVRKKVKRWTQEHRNFGAIASGLRDTHRRGRKAMTRALKSGTAADFHEWRKAMKAFWYGLRLVERCGTRVRRDVAALRKAETWLGDDHNLAVLCAELSKDASVCGSAVDVDRLRLAADREQCASRKQAIAAARPIYARSSRAYVHAVERAWIAFQRGGSQRRPRTAA